MKITEHPQLNRMMLDHLATRYKINEKREGIHLSTLIYCLTKQQYDQECFADPTDEEVMLFALGFGLQEVLTPSNASTPIIEKDGIMYSPDFTLNIPVRNEVEGGHFSALNSTASQLVELKTTRMSAKRGDSFDFPDTWLEYMKGGSYIQDSYSYDLSILFMMGYYSPPFPVIKSYHFEFNDEELNGNWEYLMERKKIYEDALSTGTPIPPYTQCKDWECKYCRYRLMCETTVNKSKNGD